MMISKNMTSPSEPRLVRSNPPPSHSDPFEQAIYAHVPKKTATALAEFRRSLAPFLRMFEKRLTEPGVLVSGKRSVIVVALRLLIALLAPAMGVVKIGVGLSPEKPVTYLIVLCIVSTVVALDGFARRPHRTRLGDRLLASLK